MNTLSSHGSVLIALLAVTSFWIVALGEESTLQCDKSVPCDCCLDGLCHNGSNVCSGEFCKDGYWGGSCTETCPEECVSCHRNFMIEQVCFECVPGYYGNKCDNNCPIGCKNKICEKSNGQCKECNDGYFGKHECEMPCSGQCNGTSCDINDGACNGCVRGFYGTYCNLTCPLNCTNNICIQESGVCMSCKPGYFGSLCETMCPPNCLSNLCYMNAGNCLACVDGFHGLNCSDTCPVTCIDYSCKIYSGVCAKGCIPNFIGDFCDSCVQGKYGVDCKDNCSSNCDNIECTKDDGACIGGCKDGFSDSKFCCANNTNCHRCSSYVACTQCINGTYGPLCEHNCPEYCKGGCDKTSGHCFECVLNHYGPLCEHTCSKHCLSPDNGSHSCLKNGTCKLTCTDGYYGEKCDTECSPACNVICDRYDGQCGSCSGNTFGQFCGYECSETCLSVNARSSCFQANGTCVHGCKANFYGDICNKTCLIFCNGSCFRESGVCQGCVFNYFGLYCDSNCSETCEQRYQNTTTCLQNNGTCIHGCIEGYVGQQCEHIAVSGENGSSSAGIIVPSVIVPVIVVAVVIPAAVAVVLKRRKRQDDKSTDSDKTKLGTKYENTAFDGANHAEEEELEEGPLVFTTVPPRDENPYYSNARMPQTKFSKQNLMRILSKSDEDYKQEFEFLPSGLIKSFTEATKSGNAHKNRYKRIYPYDDSRVNVAGADSDYINASYIHGSKCDQYWPNVNMRSKYAEFVVHCSKEEVFAEFVVRSLTITKGKDTRHINHVNFTAWPDKGVPHDVISIINLRHKVDKMKKMFKESPLLVHCSAGVGRTGTYIALDILTHHGYAEDEIDVFGCVVDMRQNRTTMVQTLEQYQFLHHAVLWTLTSDIDPLPSERFVDRSWLNDHKLAEMFSQLQIPNFYDNEEERLSIANNKKIPFTNRQGADIPGWRHGVSLMMNEMANKSSYINAVYIDGYRAKERFIAAMTPLPDTVTDFLGMLLQENVTSIVDLTPLDSEQQDIGEYLSADNQDIENESHVFRITAREVQGCFVKREIEISKKKMGKKADIKTLHHFQFTKWNANAPLPHIADFVTLVNAVDAATIKMDIAGPIVVHCLSGAKRSGLFCAVWLLIERMTIDHAVSVLNTLRQVKTRRRGAIPNKEQIGFCFDCVDHHLKYLSERVYSNTALQTGGQEMAQV